MIPIIYYAHSLKIYNTPRELEELQRLRVYFNTGLIYNPNRPDIQQSKNPMGMCIRRVKDPYIISLAFSHQDRKIPSGVYAEIRIAQKYRKPVYVIESQKIREYRGIIKVTKKDRATDWARV